MIRHPTSKGWHQWYIVSIDVRVAPDHLDGGAIPPENVQRLGPSHIDQVCRRPKDCLVHINRHGVDDY